MSVYDAASKELKLDEERYRIDSTDEMRLQLNYEHSSGSFAYLFSSMVGSIKLFDGPGGDKSTTMMEWTVVVKDGMIALAFPCQAGQRIRKKLQTMMESMETFVLKEGVGGGGGGIAAVAATQAATETVAPVANAGTTAELVAAAASIT